MKDNNIHKLIEDTINSMDGHVRATPAPYLMARIHNRLANHEGRFTSWDKLIAFLTRPSIAFAIMVVIVMLNVFIINTKTTESAETVNIESYLDGSAVAGTSSINYEWNP